MFQTFGAQNVLALMGTMEDRFSSKEVISLTSITARQLQWWDERGIVVPAREGHKRFYSLDDLAEVAVLCELRQRGFSLQRVRKVMRFLQRELGKRLVETVTDGSEYHLLTDGRNLYLEDSAHAVINILKNSKQPILGICITDTVERLRARIGKKQAQPAVSTRTRMGSGRRKAS
ncbi:transcriptional regulator, MerR family [Candidatus Koribacter versatilis Ellin345]|uniref:Transcriptional regulator, MerR family n=1 Tax=Koribacter versatilis (strain Ellin345) TaxID=204669 RepID=Q1IS29_KORVE|nr:MerR family transcriptional regulator [Candidatus Koribacter versatilis]ABF40321.1 transcriptional regulator, MerR family [Candidatus Koribacter versatilis Ellin345]